MARPLFLFDIGKGEIQKVKVKKRSGHARLGAYALILTLLGGGSDISLLPSPTNCEYPQNCFNNVITRDSLLNMIVGL